MIATPFEVVAILISTRNNLVATTTTPPPTSVGSVAGGVNSDIGPTPAREAPHDPSAKVQARSAQTRPSSGSHDQGRSRRRPTPTPLPSENQPRHSKPRLRFTHRRDTIKLPPAGRLL